MPKAEVGCVAISVASMGPLSNDAGNSQHLRLCSSITSERRRFYHDGPANGYRLENR